MGSLGLNLVQKSMFTTVTVDWKEKKYSSTFGSLVKYIFKIIKLLFLSTVEQKVCRITVKIPEVYTLGK